MEAWLEPHVSQTPAVDWQCAELAVHTWDLTDDIPRQGIRAVSRTLLITWESVVHQVNHGLPYDRARAIRRDQAPSTNGTRSRSTKPRAR